MDSKAWNSFVRENGPKSGSFLQSWEWGEFQKSLGRKVIRVLKNDFAAQIIKMPLGFRFNYLYIPKGPIFKKSPSPTFSPSQREGEIKRGWDSLIEIAKKEKAIFIRFEPPYQPTRLPSALSRQAIGGQATNPPTGDLPKGDNYQLIKTKSIQPRCTLVLNLENPFEDTLAQMHPKTRYNIRLAERHGIEVNSGNHFGDFLHLLKKTGERDKFRLHPDNYYKKMLESLTSISSPPASRSEIGQSPHSSPCFAEGEIGGVRGGENFTVKLWVTKYRNQIIAANLIGYFGDTATYLHGASLYDYRNLMAPYLLHWKIIKDAKIEGYKSYDWWGINEKKWPGVTKFKKGFASTASPDRSDASIGPTTPTPDDTSGRRRAPTGRRESVGSEEVCSPGTFDMPIKKGLYVMYRLARNLKGLI